MSEYLHWVKGTSSPPPTDVFFNPMRAALAGD